jgi:hypothetical protein
MNYNELLNLEYKFAKAVFTSGIPFNAFQNLFWREFFIHFDCLLKFLII